MKLATFDDSNRDGQLRLVSRDLRHWAPVPEIAATLIDALERWEAVEPALSAAYDALNAGSLPGAEPFAPAQCRAPLPRASAWLDGSCFLHHGRLMERAFNAPAIEDFETVPLIYQGGSDDLLGPCEPVPFVSEADQIDLEGEFGVIVGDVPMAASEAEAAGAIRLLVQLNDWSLRRYAPYEMRRGFGWVLAKPATSFAPVAITPDELGDGWRDGRVALRLRVAVNGREIGRPTGAAMNFSFPQLIAHSAKTRRLKAGTIVGSGTVSNDDPAAGSTCLSEVRVLEILATGAPQTPFLSFGDRVVMEALSELGETPFGAVDHVVSRV